MLESTLRGERAPTRAFSFGEKTSQEEKERGLSFATTLHWPRGEEEEAIVCCVEDAPEAKGTASAKKREWSDKGNL